jgi:hypothetical protein
MDGVALARHFNAHPEETEEVKDLVFVFLDSEVDDPDGYRMVTVVYRVGDRWIVNRYWLVDVYLGRRNRPVLPSTPAAAGE